MKLYVPEHREGGALNIFKELQGRGLAAQWLEMKLERLGKATEKNKRFKNF